MECCRLLPVFTFRFGIEQEKAVALVGLKGDVAEVAAIFGRNAVQVGYRKQGFMSEKLLLAPMVSLRVMLKPILLLNSRLLL